jgi:hypothetical protein
MRIHMSARMTGKVREGPMTTPGSDPSAYGEGDPGSMPPPPAYDAGTGYPGQGAYPSQGGYPGQGGPMNAPKNGFGIAALVLGILAIVLSWSAVGGILLGVLAIIFGILGIRRAGRGQATNKGMAISGLVTGIVGLIIGIIVAVALGSFLSVFGGSVNDLKTCLQNAGQDSTQIQQCDTQYQQQIQQKIGGN